MPYVPALDGLRGVAVAAVLLYHQGYGWARGGFLGVSLFFTLSGFLITMLVLSEHEATNRLRLRNFWSRRVRRLAPAGLFGIALALLALVVAVPAAQQASGAADIRAALVQMANWRFIVADAPYADIGTVPSPVLHYWSLAIEEQFYLVFPLLALATLRRGYRMLVAALGGVVVVSLFAQIAMSGDRVYLGTETRAAELAIGCLLAVAWRKQWGRSLSTGSWDVVALVSLALTMAMWVVVRQSDPRLLGGGLVAVGLVSAMVIAGAMGGSLVPRALAAGPIRFVGVISYGLYVVHFPLFLILTPARTGLAGTSLFLVRVAVSMGVATLFYMLIELPIREGRLILGRQLRGRPAGGLVLASLAGLAIATVPAVPPRSGEPARADDGVSVVTSDPRPARTVPSSPSPSPAPSPTVAPTSEPNEPAAPPTSQQPTARETGPSEPPIPLRPPRIVVVGDSTANGIGQGLQEWAADTESMQISVVTSSGCAVLVGEVARYREGFEFTPSGCAELFPAAIREAERIDADAFLVFIGSAQLADWRFGADPAWRNITEADIGRAYVNRLTGAVDDLSDTGIPVLWADMPLPDWDLDSFGDIIGGQLPGSGEPVVNDPVRTKLLNEHTIDVLDSRGGATTMLFADGLAGPDGIIQEEDRADGLHLSEDQVIAAADTWFMPMVVDAWAAAWQELGATAPAEVAWPLPS